MTVSRILDLTRTGRLSPEDGAMLFELRRMIAWRRRPWWQRWLTVAAHFLVDWPLP